LNGLVKPRACGVCCGAYHENLSRKWGIGLETAAKTLEVTTHKGMVRSNMPYDRKVRQRFNQLKFPTVGGTWYTDTAFANVKSIRGMNCSQIWTNGLGFDHFNPLETTRDVHQSLTRFIQDVGIPNLVISDDLNAQVAGEFGKIASLHHIKRMITMPYSPWQNRAESSIRELKWATIRLMRKHDAPQRTWCYAGEAAARIRRLTASDLCGGRTPEEVVSGKQIRQIYQKIHSLNSMNASGIATLRTSPMTRSHLEGA
jgi:hypothetical protein